MGGLFLEVGPDASWPQILIQTGLYGYVLFEAANLIGDGAELLLLCPAYASIVGTIVIPILGAVPDGMMVLCSGLGPDAQEQVKVGVGALAGSTIMLLTFPWFLAVLYGRVDLDEDGRPKYNCPRGEEKLSSGRKFDFLTTGVGIGSSIGVNAKNMLMTSTTYCIIQGAAFFVDKPFAFTPVEDQVAFENPFAWIGLVTSVGWFVYYLRTQMHTDSTDAEGKIVREIVAAIDKREVSLSGAVASFFDSAERTMGSPHGALGESLLESEAIHPHVERLCQIVAWFYSKYDTNHDRKIDEFEFRSILKDLHVNCSVDDQKRFFMAADIDNNGDISFQEFVGALIAFTIYQPTASLQGLKDSSRTRSISRVSTVSGFMMGSTSMLDDEDQPEEEDVPEDLADLDPAEQQYRIKKRAVYKMLVGSALVLFFSDPMCDILGTIGDKAGVDKFYVSFVLAPLASNASELVAAMKLASKKTKSSMLNSLSTLEGAAIMNNTFCLSIFLALIVWKGLVWQFTAETVSILLIQVLVGMQALRKDVHTLADGAFILMMYPLSLLVVYALEAAGFD